MSMVFASMMASATAAAAREHATHASYSARSAQRRTDELEARIERLALVAEALWTLMRDKAGVSEQELIDRIIELDLLDGRLDGKSARPAARMCAKCSRSVGKRFDKCLYCSEPIARDPFA